MKEGSATVWLQEAISMSIGGSLTSMGAGRGAPYEKSLRNCEGLLLKRNFPERKERMRSCS